MVSESADANDAAPAVGAARSGRTVRRRGDIDCVDRRPSDSARADRGVGPLPAKCSHRDVDICALGAAFCTWRITVRLSPVPAARARRALVIASEIVVVFLVGAAPLLWQAVRLVAQGAYVTPTYQWRSALVASSSSHRCWVPPFHPLLHGASRAYAVAHLDRIEAVGLVRRRADAAPARRPRRWTPDRR